MWWLLSYKTILEYLDKSKDSDLKKDKLISRKQERIKNEISKLQIKELVYYLFDSQINENVKKLIIERIEEIFSRTWVKDDIDSITELITSKNVDSKTLEKLYKTYGKNSVTTLLSEKLYPDSLCEIVKNKSISTKSKQMLIILKFNSNDIVKILEDPDDKELLYFIIKEPKYRYQDIKEVLNSTKIAESIKEEVIKYQINISNIQDLLATYLNKESKEKVFEMKSSVINEIINSLNEKTIIKFYDTIFRSDDLAEMVFSRRKDTIVNVINKTPKSELWDLLSRARYSPISELIIKLRKTDFNESLKEIRATSLLNILSNKDIPSLSKSIILQYRKKDVESQIADISTFGILTYMENTSFPNEVKELILSLNPNTVKKSIKEIDEDYLKYYITSKYYSKFEDLIIELRVNEKNIFELLKFNNRYPEKAEKIIKLKNEIIRKKLSKLSYIDLITINNIDLIETTKNEIIKANKDIIEKLIQEEDPSYSDVAYLLKKEYIPEEIKKLLLRHINIDEENLSGIIELINSSNNIFVINRYEELKSFMSLLGINIKSFIQYGSGSTTYKTWLTDVLNIIDNGKTEDFLKVSSYFFKNFYDEDSKKENNVYVISNLLELLKIYTIYPELCASLIAERPTLSKEDKQDLRFLFNIKSTKNIKNINELKGLRRSTYNEYSALVKSGKIKAFNIYQIKKIFNDILFSNAIEEIKKIDGSCGVEALRNYNKNNEFLCRYIDELMKYVSIIELVEYSNDTKGLIEVLEYIFSGSYKEFLCIQGEFSDLGKKIQRLYELDSQMNLTKLEKARKLPNVVSEELSKKYGGEVLDFSDKNYILYAHVLSNKEKLEDVINGRSNGKSNFISVSPISYAGQKYYYDYSNMILLYDEIRTGSFICSSRENIGSNRLIKNNSSEVSVQNVRQKGILETSSATKQNAEALLYREGLIPKGIALPGGREPNTEEMECHKKYNLPFVITQEPRGVIENVKEVFKPNTEYEEQLESNKTLEKVLQILSPKINIKKENDIYTGREIGLFTDSHALYEPTLAVLEDMRKNGITEIYSLGDNIGLGPNPTEVLDMLSYYKVTSIMGNSEYYNTLGIEPFTYFNPIKEENQEWTRNRLGTDKIERMKLWTPSIDIAVGDKKIALCHFANDIRWDYKDHSTWTYQDNFKEGVSSKQFLYTNSPESKKKIQDIITSNRRNLEYIRGLVDAQNSPLFNGKKVTDYDSIIQGHVHFQMEDKLDDTKVHTLRAAGIGYKDDPKDMACYYVLKEKKDGTYDIEKKLVSFNRNLLLSNIKSSSIPHKEPILRMTN